MVDIRVFAGAVFAVGLAIAVGLRGSAIARKRRILGFLYALVIGALAGNKEENKYGEEREE